MPRNNYLRISLTYSAFKAIQPNPNSMALSGHEETGCPPMYAYDENRSLFCSIVLVEIQ